MTVALGRFSELLGHGVEQVLRADATLQVIQLRDLTRVRHLQPMPQVVLLDADTATPDTIRRLRAISPVLQVIGLSHRQASSRWTKGVWKDAICVSKDVSGGDLLKAVRVAAVRASLERPAPAGFHTLTPRENEVLALLTAGRTHDQIADKLGMSTETARSHTASIRYKLSVRANRDLIGMPFPSS